MARDGEIQDRFSQFKSALNRLREGVTLEVEQAVKRDAVM